MINYHCVEERGFIVEPAGFASLRDSWKKGAVLSPTRPSLGRNFNMHALDQKYLIWNINQKSRNIFSFEIWKFVHGIKCWNSVPAVPAWTEGKIGKYYEKQLMMRARSANTRQHWSERENCEYVHSSTVIVCQQSVCYLQNSATKQRLALISLKVNIYICI